jgi:4-hydroxy-tetrahydrodipicolinate reductase
VQWTTGHVARFATQAVLDAPHLELVGCFAHSPDKVGRDVGELVDRAPIGVAATDDVDALVALRPDVVVYNPLLQVAEVPAHVELLERLLRAGINVVTASNFVTGRWWGAEERLAAAGAAGGASLFGAGVNPGFINAFALTAASVCSSVKAISIWEEAECSGYDSADLWETVGFGRLPDDPETIERARRGTNVFEDTVAMMADALDLPLDEVRYAPEIAVADVDLDLGFMRIARGHVAGLRNRWLGIAGGREVIELGTLWKMTEQVTPNWPVRHGWHVEVDGLPVVKVHVAGWPPADDTSSEVLMSLAMIMTAMPLVHAIPHVVAARPGVVTYKDLPLVTAARFVR